MRRITSRSSGFTLVELLVVIGIIAALIGILLPVLGIVRERGRDLKCQANIRSILQAVHTYAAEHDGSMPWGFVWNRFQGPTWDPDFADQRRYLNWATLVGRYMNRMSDGIAEYTGANFATVFPKALQCPEADLWRPHIVSYAGNLAVFIDTRVEYSDPAGSSALPGRLYRPPRATDLLRETAVVWDTAILEEWLMTPLNFRLGHDIDNQRFWGGAEIPQQRYFSLSDPFSRIPPGIYGQTRPIVLNVAGRVFRNREPGTFAAEGGYPYQGNLRFRHRRNTTCNVGFIDGSVRQFTAKMNPDKTVRSHDAIRRYFMIRWPTGVRPDPRYPS